MFFTPIQQEHQMWQKKNIERLFSIELSEFFILMR